MKVTLVYIDSVEGFDCLDKTNYLGLGLAYVGGYLKEKGYDVGLVDTRELRDWDEFKSELKKSQSDVVGIHTSTVSRNDAVTAAKIAKELDMLVVAGGPHASILPKDLLDTGFFDHVIRGEGEIAFYELLKNLEKGIETERVINSRPIEELDELPLPDRELFNLDTLLKNPSGLFPLPNPELIVSASRGCVFNCAFCQPSLNQIFGKGIRRRSVDSVIEEIRFLKERYKIKAIQFQDDTFTVNRKWVFDFTEKLKNEKLDFVWFANSRVDTIDDEMARRLHEAGCILIGIGFESGSQRILNLLRKGTTVQQGLAAAKICKKNDLFIHANVMIGNPTETVEELKQTLLFVNKIKPEMLYCSVFSPIPGTYLHDFCEEKDLITVSDPKLFQRGNFNQIKGLETEVLVEYANKIQSQKMHWLQSKNLMKASLYRWLCILKQGNMRSTLRDVATFRPSIVQKFKYRNVA